MDAFARPFAQPFAAPLPTRHSSRRAYIDRLLATEPANLIAYWPLVEESGTVATDYSGNGFHGTSLRDFATMGRQAGIGDNNTAPTFTPGSDYVNIYSAGFAAAFNPAEGTMQAWIQPASGVMADGAQRLAVALYGDNNNRVYIAKTVANQFWLNYRAGGTSLGATPTDYNSDPNWLHLLIRWSVSGNYVKPYINGIQVGPTMTGLGTWAGALNATHTCIGALNTSFLNPWSGGIAHVAAWDIAIPEAA